MPVTIEEHFDSRHVTNGDSPSAELRYTIRGTNDYGEAMIAMITQTPTTFDINGDGSWHLPRANVSIDPLGDRLWNGNAQYGPRPTTNDAVYSFDTSGGTQHITQSLQTVGKYAAPGQTAPDNQGAIGVTGQGPPEGVDITVPVYNFGETHYKSALVVTPAYRYTLFQLTGKVNQAEFRGWGQGDVLFLGASGSKRDSGDWEIAYRFAASETDGDITVGDITGIAKKGWEYLWVRYMDAKDEFSYTLVQKPVAAYVERVYKYGDFALLGI